LKSVIPEIKMTASIRNCFELIELIAKAKGTAMQKSLLL